MNTTEQPVITSEAVAAWMQQQLANVHEKHEYGSLTVRLNGYKDFQKTEFEVYIRQGVSAVSENSFEECFNRISKINTSELSKIKREQAAALLAEAEKLEQAI